jgi:hypothetical protein
MIFRMLRIAWSVMWATVGLLLVALWVRTAWLYGLSGPAFNGEQDLIFVLVGFTAILASLSWVQGRFSLRTLLVAMTMVSMLLGLAVYAARK